MTAPSNIDPARFLSEQLAQASPDLLRQMLTTFINTLMSAEADAVLGLTPSRTSGQSPAGLPEPRRRRPVRIWTGPRPGAARRSPSCPSGAHTGGRGTSTGRSGSSAPCRPATGGGPVGRRTAGIVARGQSPIRPQRGRGRTGRHPRDPTSSRLGRDRGPETESLRPSPGEVCGGQPAAAGAVDGDQSAVAPADNCGQAALRTGLPGDALAGTHEVLFLAAEFEGRREGAGPPV